jgi:hypothetical protein
MLKAAQDRFANDYAVKVVEHDFNFPLPDSLGCFDAVVSALLYTTLIINASVHFMKKVCLEMALLIGYKA